MVGGARSITLHSMTRVHPPLGVEQLTGNPTHNEEKRELRPVQSRKTVGRTQLPG